MKIAVPAAVAAILVAMLAAASPAYAAPFLDQARDLVRSGQAISIPEPGTMLVFGGAMALLGLRMGRSRKP